MRVRDLGRVAYLPTWQAMQEFTATRSESSEDQLWLCEHDPVFTQGVAGKAEHVLQAGAIPLVQTDRGGQVTFHGPGQVIGYPLVDLRRLGVYVKEYVHRLEESVIRTLGHFGVTGHRVRGAPGIYVNLDDPFGHSSLPVRAEPFDGLSTGPVEAPAGGPFDALRANGVPVGKIAALGIKVSRHCTYHGVALNVAMDLEPFGRIHPCGHAGLQTVDLSTIGVSTTPHEAQAVLGRKLATFLAP
jgi:lipoyl(octanoyl) transferase